MAGNVGTFTARAFVDTRLFLGFSPYDPQDPLNSGGAFTPLKLTTFQVTGLRGSTDPAFRNSVVVAATVGSVSLKSVQTSNGDQTFGILAPLGIGSVRAFAPAFTFNKARPTTQGVGQFEVVIA